MYVHEICIERKENCKDSFQKKKESIPQIVYAEKDAPLKFGAMKKKCDVQKPRKFRRYEIGERGNAAHPSVF